MATIQEQIEEIQEEIRKTPYHKGTEHFIGKMRAKIARLKDKQIETESKGKGSGGGGYSVKHQGDATIILIGPPSAGKSTLLNKLTNAKSKVAPYAFTTVSVIPGMMYYREAKLQILDVPGLIEGAEEGKGRGREVLSVTRGADLIILITDVERPKTLDKLENALIRNGIRPNQSPPDVLIEKKLQGGIILHSNIKQDLSNETIKEIIAEMGVKNADITLREKLTMERLIDSLSRNRVYIPMIKVVNKADLMSKKYKDSDFKHAIVISAETEKGIVGLKEEIWKTLQFAHIFLIDPDEDPGMEKPVIVKQGVTLKEVGKSLGSDFLENKKKAKIWGPGAKFPGQEVSLSTNIQDGMQVRFI